MIDYYFVLSIYAAIDEKKDPSFIDSTMIQVESMEDLYNVCQKIEEKFSSSQNPKYHEVTISITQLLGNKCIGNTTFNQLKSHMTETGSLRFDNLDSYN